MRMKPIVLALLAAVVLAPAVLRAGDAPEKQQAPAVQTAVFAVPDVGDEAVKKLTAALAKTEGVMAAKAETEQKKFLVTFESAKTNAEALAAVVTGVQPEAKLEVVQAADPAEAHAGCGKCPSKSSCEKAKKATS